LPPNWTEEKREGPPFVGRGPSATYSDMNPATPPRTPEKYWLKELTGEK